VTLRHVPALAGPNVIDYLDGTKLEVHFMLFENNRRIISVVAGSAFGLYTHAQSFDISPAPAPKSLLSIAAASSTSSVSAITLNLTTFAKLDPPPPIVPAKDKQQQT
jgi:hypothetical protein